MTADLGEASADVVQSAFNLMSAATDRVLAVLPPRVLREGAAAA